ncbi:4Fe-4S ferredoxin N-terminal domain-containing protein [Natronorubrum daqingense]|uniref:4Fe-4S ferredoxin n=1 Tax=Natronorubrum daqingense TaxID=588898 RepID=A0A1N6XF58_9EURY|nr:4Fe-4S ferredoxin N-terminal domain-containing protein [Natronorubrum daqingense]APX95970.1 4Fe-4S ferredoxin [Natronorubrum daqingense]SIR00955.1 prokaryotic molybdopterin-containing oxidoreductase family, iron-sulfur binding subunit [Natronorubrum daqingense]
MSTDDESFHPLGQEWETELEGMLDDTEYDSDLGMQMAQDAMRVTKGELSEAEFHEMYHDDVMDEFGVDDRPTEEAYEAAQEEGKGGVARMLSAFDDDGEEGRRDVMKKMGVGAAAVGLGAWGTVDDSEPSLGISQEGDDAGGDGDDVQMGMTIDLEQCDGCLSCMSACAEENNLDQGVNWMYVLEYDEPEGTPDTSNNLLVRPCQHCTDAPCEKVCPTTARHTRDSDGLVLTDYDVCIGCRYCQVACPYGVNYFQWNEPDISTDEIAEDHEDMDSDHMTSEDRWVDSRAPRGTMSKCTMCPTRQDGGMGDEMVGTTACEETCPQDAIHFGNMNDETSDPQIYADNPSRGRTLTDFAPDEADVEEELEELEDALDGEDEDLDAVLDAYDFQGLGAVEDDEEGLALLLALEITAEDELGGGEDYLAQNEEFVAAALEIIADHGLDLESQEVLSELDLADAPEEDDEEDDENGADEDEDEADEEEEDEAQDEFDGPDEGAAQSLIEQYAGTPASSFRLLEDMGTNPNIIYLGNEPGPNAEQSEDPEEQSDYGNVSYQRADGDRVDLVDNRKEILDDETVGDAGVSL